MLQEIINNFENECEKNPNDMMKRIICNRMVEKLQTASDEILKNIIDSKLTISGSIERMKKEASKNKTGGYAVLTDEQGYKIIDEYFGLNTSSDTKVKEAQKTVSLFDVI